MQLNQLVDFLELKPLTQTIDAKKTVEGCYICDLLSHAIKQLKQGNIWLTVQTNPNVIAVAVLADVGCVIIPESISVSEAVIGLAEREHVAVFSSPMSSYEISAKLSDM